ncbi:P-loop containing nucleoside triphosphate hydrolase protein [Linderina pennispora]|uniref:p-loop containing nucleoside triphosphate hydrolase protein n=1 Tax=Linderina pennispora TaxID=61395 RepID=A0A1Y1WN17_9FUNG|nr:P-loop containing nucleoside triphosphate hydrolase protein [Linderina pennispora]ORX74765.1 P-loop containing nucleoside triphosphate hydrolase protein [Linderina pennispora]
MYTLVSGAYKYLTRQDEYTILMLGLDGSGKTTLLERIKHMYIGLPLMDADKIKPTVGVNIGKVHVKRTLLKFMDLGGARELQGIWESYYGDGHALLFVIDSVDEERLGEAKQTLLRLMKDRELEGIPMLVLANKQDTQDAGSLVHVKEVVNTLADCMDARDVRVMDASGKEGHGVKAAIDWLYSRIIENRQRKPPVTNI